MLASTTSIDGMLSTSTFRADAVKVLLVDAEQASGSLLLDALIAEGYGIAYRDSGGDALFDQGEAERRRQMRVFAAGRAEAQRIGAFVEPGVSARALESIGAASKSKTSRVFPGGGRASPR